MPRSFDLFTDALYANAAKAINENMKAAVKAGVKSSATEKDTLDPAQVRTIFLNSDPIFAETA